MKVQGLAVSVSSPSLRYMINFLTLPGKILCFQNLSISLPLLRDEQYLAVLPKEMVQLLLQPTLLSDIHTLWPGTVIMLALGRMDLKEGQCSFADAAAVVRSNLALRLVRQEHPLLQEGVA